MAKKKESNNTKLPSLLAYEKKLVPSDGYLYGTVWDDNHINDTEPLKITEKAVRGTDSTLQENSKADTEDKFEARITKANLQTVDACMLGVNQDTIVLTFTLKILSGVETPIACNDVAFNDNYYAKVKEYIKKTGCRELAHRYATNIANGRFLWRNRLGAEKVEVYVKADDLEATFSAYDYSLRNFDRYDENLDRLAGKIASALSGDIPYLYVEVKAYAKVGFGQEVYPSEELVFSKGKEDKSKILYQSDSIAAMHSQKIGNALRTVDTWYPDYPDKENSPVLAAEVYGAVTTRGRAFRMPNSKQDFYTLFKKYMFGEEPLTNEEEHYVVAVLIRGGVFGESDKKDKKDG